MIPGSKVFKAANIPVSLPELAAIAALPRDHAAVDAAHIAVIEPPSPGMIAISLPKAQYRPALPIKMGRRFRIGPANHDIFDPRSEMLFRALPAPFTIESNAGPRETKIFCATSSTCALNSMN